MSTAVNAVEMPWSADEIRERVRAAGVVGAGGAGVAAAVEANDNGASVVLLEKLTQIGGTTATSQGMVGGYETKYTKALDVHYTFEEMYGNLMSNASYRLDPALTTITVERSGETIDWMGERLGTYYFTEYFL